MMPVKARRKKVREITLLRHSALPALVVGYYRGRPMAWWLSRSGEKAGEVTTFTAIARAAEEIRDREKLLKAAAKESEGVIQFLQQWLDRTREGKRGRWIKDQAVKR